MHPGSAPPGTSFPAGPSVGAPAVGIQAKQVWTASETDDRQVLSLMRAPSLWRVTLHGEAVLFRVSYGTSGNITIKDVMAPARFVVPGSCDVYAYPYRPYEDGAPTSHAEVTATPATSGSAALLRVHRFGLVVPLDPNAARFVALVNSVVVVGPGLAAQSVNLLPLESVLLTSGSVLTSGDGYLEFEP